MTLIVLGSLMAAVLAYVLWWQDPPVMHSTEEAAAVFAHSAVHKATEDEYREITRDTGRNLRSAWHAQRVIWWIEFFLFICSLACVAYGIFQKWGT